MPDVVPQSFKCAAPEPDPCLYRVLHCTSDRCQWLSLQWSSKKADGLFGLFQMGVGLTHKLASIH